MSPIKVLVLGGLALTFAIGGNLAGSDPTAGPRDWPQPAESFGPSAAVTSINAQVGEPRMLLDDLARRISFQALLTNEQGNPIPMPNGAHELDFRVYDSELGGVPVGDVLDVLVTLDGGVASTMVGPLDPAWFDGTARWLGVTVDNGNELTPLIPLGSALYAFRVDRVASPELDNDIELGDAMESGSLTVHSGPGGPGRIVLHGQGQLMETRDDSGTLVALYGNDAVSGGGACLLGTAAGTTGLLLDGDAVGNLGGYVALFNADAAQAISLTASDGTIRAGSVDGGVSGNIHLFPRIGGSSRIHLDGEAGDLRLGLTGESSGNLRLYGSGGGIERIHVNGGASEIILTDGSQTAIELDGLANRISTYGNDGQENARMWGSSWGEILLYDSDASNDRTVSLAARSFFGDSGGLLTLFNNDATATGVSLVGGSGSGGFGWFYNDPGDVTVTVDGDDGDGGGRVSLQDGTQETVRLDGNGVNGGGEVVLWNSAGTPTVVIDAAPARIGIGTSNPDQELVVQGDDPAVQIRDDTTDNSANAARLELLERAAGNFDGGAFFWWNGATDKLLIGTKVSGVNTNVLVVDRATSSVGIGTQNPGNYRLAVNGPVRAKEIVVETGWADFVFDTDYDLPSLEQVEAHINQHGRLPDIPSAEEVSEHGVKVGEMESKLLQKVEELTLHLIEMDKRLKALEHENAQLKGTLDHEPSTAPRAEK